MLFRRERNRGGSNLVGQLDGVETGSCGGPVLGRQFEVAVARPLAKDAEEVAQVFLGVEPMQSCRSDEGKQVAGASDMVVAADEKPCLSSDGNPAQLALGMVVVESQPSVVEKTHERGLLAHEVSESAAQSAADRPDFLVLGFCPGEEGFDQRAAVDVAQTFDLVVRLTTPGLLDG